MAKSNKPEGEEPGEVADPPFAAEPSPLAPEPPTIMQGGAMSSAAGRALPEAPPASDPTADVSQVQPGQPKRPEQAGLTEHLRRLHNPRERTPEDKQLRPDRVRGGFDTKSFDKKSFDRK